MKAFAKLYKNRMPLSQIKKSMKDWHSSTWTDEFADGESGYDKFIRDKRLSIKKSNLEKFTIRDRLKILDAMDKCMDYHMKWKFTMAVFKKFEKKNKKITTVQSLQRGNKDRRTLEKTHKWYQDSTLHWKKKNKSKIKKELIKTMIDEDMSESRKTTLMSEIDGFMKDKFTASKKKTKRKIKSKKAKSKKAKSKKAKSKKAKSKKK